MFVSTGYFAMAQNSNGTPDKEHGAQQGPPVNQGAAKGGGGGSLTQTHHESRHDVNFTTDTTRQR